MIKKSRLRWFGHVERKDDDGSNVYDWEAEGFPQRGRRERHGAIVLRMIWKV